ncbi:hypothetical protein HG536_0B02700 [Torulaspora globosa]|uniref:DNA mismatch repair protein PMS1 n=1 Tax=Torulaspora globosa TaxID=48254 RepID=A0A7G3ZD21_9SACH|nr:uncharacterized protein HG536_0B02700 [Torulaspora globosa]QLL31407.1 hypothetical protein HG536_0B02700 [Torulaspora globosa]
MTRISAIAGDDIHKITSSQVIVDLITCVKELVDNSIDAGAHNIEVVFKNYGMESIECSDDGEGISSENFESLALKHFTSKIRSFQDVSSVTTLGFRGEALSSICSVARMSVVTTTKPPRADKLEYDTNGVLISKTTVSRNKGTTVLISDLFYNLPVRRKELEKSHKRQFSKCLSLLQAYALIQDDVQFSVWNVTSNRRKRLILSTARCQDMPKKILSIFGSSSMRGLAPIELELDLNPYKKMMNRYKIDMPAYRDLDYIIKVRGYISKSSFGCGRSAKDRQCISVNKRPVEYPALLQCCNEVYHNFNNVQFPTVFLDLSLSPQLLDVNVTPDKRTIMLHNERYIIEVFRENLINYYDSQELVLPKSGLSQFDDPKVKKRKLASQVLESHYCEDDSSDDESFQSSLSVPAKEEPGNSSTPMARKHVTPSERSSVSTPSESNASPSPAASTQTLPSKFVNIKELQKSDSCLYDASSEEFAPESSEDAAKIPKSQSLKDTLERYKKSSQGDSPSNDKDAKSSHKTESIVVEVEGKKLDYQAKYSKSEGLAFICDAASSPTKPCCDDHAKSEMKGDDSEEDPEDDSFYASMEPREVNMRSDVPWRVTHNVPRSTYRSLTGRNDSRRFEGDGLVVKQNIDSSFRMVHVMASRMSGRRQSGKHVNSFKRNEDLENFDEGERYLTLTVKKSDFEEMEVVGQFNLGFIIVTRHARGKYDLFIIDQHASDEKYNFEMLQKSTTFKSQKLIAPLPVELSVIDELLVMEHLDIFEKNGFKLIINEQETQGCKIEITNLPVSKRTLFNVDDFYELVYLIKENSGLHRNNIRCSKIRSMFAMRACRSSIMIGKPLAKATMTKVVRHLSELDKPWNCPHGRPTMRHLMEINDWDSFSSDYEI